MFKKEYSLENFRIDCNKPILSTTGQFVSPATWEGKFWNINLSSILSRLIVDTGRFAENYASDLFISWKSFEKELENPDYSGGKYLFGIRQSGVDHESFLISRFNDMQYHAENYYRKIYVMIVTVEPDGYMTVELGEARIR